MKHLVSEAFKGFNCTILAYGQTGSGKTYTMGSDKETLEQLLTRRSKSLGQPSESHGLIPRVLADLFALIEHEKEEKSRVSFKVSFVEIYMEKIVDLLSLKRNRNDDQELKIRDCNGQISIKDLCEVEVDSLASVVKLLQRGSAKRSVGATAMNAQSSRSHAIITFNLAIKKGAHNQIVRSKINLIDLAGSESQKNSKTTGAVLNEGIQINQGLSQLRLVVKQLAEKKKVVSYRDSNLTHLLKDSLGGNTKTLIIACISSNPSNQDESINTIKYAQFARQIQNKVSINLESGNSAVNNFFLKF